MADPFDSLLPAIAAGDLDAFARFMSAVELPLRRGLRSFAAQVDVEAIVQEAFLRTWQVVPRMVAEGRTDGLVALVSRIAKNLALDELKRRRESPLGAPEDDLRVESSDADPLLRQLIARCFDELPAQPRSALHARLDNDGAEPDGVLAARCNMKPNTFLQNVSRARKLLAECLRGRGVELEPHGAASWR